MALIAAAFVEVRPDTGGFRPELNRALKAALAGIRANIATALDTRGLRAEITRAARVAGAGVGSDVEIGADSRTLRRDVITAAREAEANQRLRLPVQVDARGLKTRLREAAAAASAGLKFSLPLVVDTRGLRTSLRESAESATAGVKADIPVSIDTTGLRAALRTAIVAAAANQRFRIPVTIDERGLRASLREATRTASAGVRTSVGVDAESRGLRGEVGRAASTAGSGQRSTVEVGADGRGLRGEVNRASALASANQRIRVPIDVDTRPFRASLTTFLGTIQGSLPGIGALGSVLAGLKLGALTEGFRAAAGALTSLGAGAVSLASALGPITGLLGALPGLAAAAVQGVGVIGLATAGVSDALKEMEKAEFAAGDTAEDFARKQMELAVALGKLPPSVVDFARELRSLRPVIDGLRETAASNLFPGVLAGLERLRGLIPLVRTAIAATAAEIGSFVARLGALVSSGPFAADLATIVSRNVTAIRQFGQVLLNVVDGLRNVTIAAGPLVDFLGRLSVRLSETFRGFAQTGRETGTLAAFFERTAAITERLVSITGNLYDLVVNIGRAARPMGDSLFESFDRATAGLAAFIGSTEGQSRLTAFFEGLRPTLNEVGLLVRDIAVGFIGLGTDSGLAPLIAQVRTELLPAILSVFEAGTNAFGPQFVTLLTHAATIVATLTNSFGFILPILNQILPALNAVLGAISPLIAVVGEGLASAVSQVLPTLQGLITSIAPIFAGLLTTFLPVLTRVIEAAAPVLNTLVTLVGGALGRILPLVGDSLARLAPVAESLLGRLVPVFEGVMTTLIPVIESVLAALAPVAGTLAETLGGALQSILPLLGRIVVALAPVAEQFIKLGASFLSALLPALGPVATAFEGLATSLKPVFDQLGPIAEQLGAAFGAFLSQGAANLVTFSVGLAQIAAELAPLLPDLVNLGTVVLKALADAIVPLIPDLVRLAGTFATGMRPVLDALAQILPEIVSALGKGLGEILPRLPPVVEQLAMAFAQVLPSLGQLLPIIIDIAARFIAEMLPVMERLIPVIADMSVQLANALVPVLEQLGPILPTLASAFATLVELAAPFLPYVLQAATGVVGFLPHLIRLGEIIGGTLSTAWERFGPLLGKAVDIFVSIPEKLGGVVQFFQDLPGKITGFLTDLPGKLLDIGGKIIDGLVKGITETPGKILDALLGLLPGPLRRFAGVLGINSPSTLFASYGANMGQGLVQGIEGQGPAIASAIDEMAKQATAALPPVRIPTIGFDSPELAAAAAGGEPGPGVGQRSASDEAVRLGSQALNQSVSPSGVNAAEILKLVNFAPGASPDSGSAPLIGQVTINDVPADGVAAAINRELRDAQRLYR